MTTGVTRTSADSDAFIYRNPVVPVVRLSAANDVSRASSGMARSIHASRHATLEQAGDWRGAPLRSHRLSTLSSWKRSGR
jgi:hypothetical protein